MVVYDEENSRVVIFEAKVASLRRSCLGRVMRHCARSKRSSMQKISGMNMTRSCAMVLRFTKSAASSNENQTENDT